MNTARNLQIVSLYFLLVTGLIHFFSGMMYVNEYFTDTSLLVNKVSDLPFLLAALSYLGSSIKLNIDTKPNKKLDAALITVGLIIFIGIFVLNLILKDAV